MIKYQIKAENPLSHYLQIVVEIDISNPHALELILPLWRPGRYEAAEYIKNMRNFSASDPNGNNYDIIKNAKNVWKIQNPSNKVIVTYEYFAYQLDAGGSYIDDHSWLINFINCLIYAEGYQGEPCEIYVKLPEEFEVACTLESHGETFISSNYDELADKPLLASDELNRYEYSSREIPFTIWTAGEAPVNFEELVPSFKSFSDVQLGTFDSKPFTQYFFLIVVLPFRFYHGVEHSDNTVIVLGVDNETEKQKFIDDLLGVSSHELFHTWNIKKIRPKELQPYDFSKPVIFNTGFVAEGFTTYYGDLFLCRSDVWTIERYLEELNIFLKRHYRNTGRFTASLTASSNNLWIDGYKPGPPHHKVSIYVKGALVALMLDFKIRIATNHQQSLDDVMRQLDDEFSEVGYGIDDIKSIAENFTTDDLSVFFEKHLFGIDPVDHELELLAKAFGLELQQVKSSNLLERNYGIVAEPSENKLKIENIYPGCEAANKLAIGDKIVLINNENPSDLSDDQIMSGNSINVTAQRLGRDQEIILNKTDKNYFTHFQLALIGNPTEEQKDALLKWLKCK